MKTMKKLLSMLLLACMLMSMCASAAYADGPAVTLDEETYTVQNRETETVTIRGKLKTPGDAAGPGGYDIKWFVGDELHWTGLASAGNGSDANGDFSATFNGNEFGVTGAGEAKVSVIAVKGDKDVKSDAVTVTVTNFADKIQWGSYSREMKWTRDENGAPVAPAAKKLSVIAIPEGATIKEPVAYAITSGSSVELNGNIVTAKPVTEYSQSVITATDADGHTTTFTIDVYPADPVAPSGIYFDTAEKTLTTGTSYSQAVKFTPADASVDTGVTWSVINGADKDGNPVDSGTIATVDQNGLVTASSTPGSVTVVAVLTANPTLSASYKITVVTEETPVVPKAMKFAANPMTVDVNAATVLRAYDAETGTELTNVSWAFDQTSESASLTGNTLTITAAGQTVVLRASAEGYSDGILTVATQAAVENKHMAVVVPTGLYVGGKAQLKAYDIDDTDRKTPLENVTWKIVDAATEAKYAAISGDTVIAGKQSGKVTVIASKSGYNDAQADFYINASRDPIVVWPTGSVAVNSSGIQLNAYGTNDIKHEKPLSGITWRISGKDKDSVNAQISASGFLTPGSVAGYVDVEATSTTGAKGYTRIYITEPTPSGKWVTLTSATITKRGGTATVYAQVKDAQGNSTGEVVSNIFTTALPAQASVTLQQGGNFGGWYCSYNPADKTNAATVRGGYNGVYYISASYGGSQTTAVPVVVDYQPEVVWQNFTMYDGKTNLQLRVNDAYENYDSGRAVLIDGVALQANTYRVLAYGGEIAVEVSTYVLNMLPKAAYHTISIPTRNSSYTYAVGYFNTFGGSTAINGVKTGDDSNLPLWTALLILSAAGAAAAVFIIKRRKKNGK